MEKRPVKIKDSKDVNFDKEGVTVKQVHSDRKDQQKFTVLFNHSGEPELKDYYEDQFDVIGNVTY
ncbi:uncharacterized protein YkuJ [Paenibacillus sp. PastF-3]|uniref:hypothetical protein n=1 Tax=unclassified Paenibacillus TaxID=185978 RepID=UPI0024736F90|nr:hypothetical protein [Paenibacillus sp. PastF-3]MDH6373761.1 uncharacterized protein YkuJ [Paenibacillus sp. PastF-3]